MCFTPLITNVCNLRHYVCKIKCMSSSTLIVYINECRKDKKALRNEKKSRTKKNFNLIQEVTETWEILRRHDTTAARRSELVSDILDKIKGRIADLAGSHTASRVVQACVKHGAADEHQTIFKEISPHIVPLSKSPYGRFVVSKLITVASKDQIPST